MTRKVTNTTSQMKTVKAENWEVPDVEHRHPSIMQLGWHPFPLPTCVNSMLTAAPTREAGPSLGTRGFCTLVLQRVMIYDHRHIDTHTPKNSVLLQIHTQTPTRAHTLHLRITCGHRHTHTHLPKSQGLKGHIQSHCYHLPVRVFRQQAWSVKCDIPRLMVTSVALRCPDLGLTICDLSSLLRLSTSGWTPLGESS